MKVILLKKIKGLGEMDDVKEVAEGYARNFLFPNHLAVQSTSAAIQKINSDKKKVVEKTEADLHEQQSIAGQLDGLEIELMEKANEKSVLYAAVTSQKICDSLKKQGYNVLPDQIQMKPIKKSGTFTANIKFGHGLEAEVKIIVQAIS